MNIIISAFPGMGKSTLYSENKHSFSDSDSSLFPKSDFPNNYVNYIQFNSRFKKIMLISSHISVRDELVNHNIPFIYVIPTIDRKEEFLHNYKERGSSKEFIENVNINWERWLQISVLNTKYPVYVCKNGYLKDNLHRIIAKYYNFYSVNGRTEVKLHLWEECSIHIFDRGTVSYSINELSAKCNKCPDVDKGKCRTTLDEMISCKLDKNDIYEIID